MITEKQSIKIKTKLLEQHKTVRKLSEELGITRTYLSAIISGKRNNQNIEAKLKELYLNNKK